MKNDNVMTKFGLEEIVDELQRRKKIERKKIAEEIDYAREQGDLSENAAYKAALEKKEFNENRIEELEKMVAGAVIKDVNRKNKQADLGERIVVRRKSDGKQREYVLVGENEADPSKYKISVESPIGRELVGKKIGDNVTVNMPNGKEEFEIIDLQ